MEAKCISFDGTTSNISLSDSVFGRDYNETLVHQIVTAYMSNARRGTRAQKGRSDVSKSTHKLWRQKGTGRARVGAASNPIWKGGGRIFPSSPLENFAKKVNRKMYRAGISTIFSRLLSENRLHLIENFAVATPKTKEFINKLLTLNLSNVLIITNVIDDNLYLSSRNVPLVSVIEPVHIDPVSLLKHNDVLISRDAAVKIEDMLK